MITLWDSIRLKNNHPLQHTKQHQRKLQPSSLLLNRKSGNRTKLVLMWCSHEKIQGTFHYQEVPLGMLFRALHKKVPWNKWNFEKGVLFSGWKFSVEKHVPFTGFHKESPVSGYSRRYLCHHLWWREHKRMELVSSRTRSSLHGPFHRSFRKFLVNGKWIINKSTDT